MSRRRGPATRPRRGDRRFGRDPGLCAVVRVELGRRQVGRSRCRSTDLHHDRASAGAPSGAQHPARLVAPRVAALRGDLNLEQFRAAVQPLLGAVNERSCVALSVDGYDTGSAHPDVAVLPASTEKLLVAAVALEVLGEAFTFTTRLVGPAPVGGVVTGDIYVVGGGDPVLSGDWYADVEPRALSGLQRDLARRPSPMGSSAQVSRRSKAVCSATAQPRTTTSSSHRMGRRRRGLRGRAVRRVDGNDSRVQGDELRSDDPAEAAAREFVRLLTERGVTVAGGAGIGQAPADATELASIQSLPLTDVVPRCSPTATTTRPS